MSVEYLDIEEKKIPIAEIIDNRIILNENLINLTNDITLNENTIYLNGSIIQEEYIMDIPNSTIDIHNINNIIYPNNIHSNRYCNYVKCWRLKSIFILTVILITTIYIFS
jgi:hypothetical protein